MSATPAASPGSARSATPAKTAAPAKAPPAPAPARQAAAAAPAAKRSFAPSGMRISSPADSAEREAVATARRVVQMAPRAVGQAAAPPGGRPAKPGRAAWRSRHGARFDAARSGMAQATGVQRQARGPSPSMVSPKVSAGIAGAGGGSPLPSEVRGFMEPRFGADFGNVRIHTGSQAAGLSRQLNAAAFTVGSDIYFGKGAFQPATGAGRELIAHELTHTLQQGAAVHRQALEGGASISAEGAFTAADAAFTPVTVAESSPPAVQRLGLSDALDYFAEKAHHIPGFRMFTVVLGMNPINGAAVDRSAANILRAVVEFIPGGAMITQALDNHGIFDKVGNWVEGQIRTLGLVGSAFAAGIDQFLDSLSWSDIFDLGGVWERAKRIFTGPLDQLLAFLGGLLSSILGFIREAILRPLGKLAEGSPAYDLLKAVLGQDPVTGDPVPQTADTLIGGFMKLIGQEEIWNNLKKANAVARAFAWFQGALSGLLGFVRQIPGLFLQAFTSLELMDLVLVPRAFAKIAAVFGSFAGQFMSWAGNTIWNLLEIIFDVLAPSVMPYLRKAAGAFRTILQNPVGFVGNLVRAGKLGFQQFGGRFLQHLRASLIGWLTGAMSGAGVYIPQGFDLREILKFVLSVLGLTWANIRAKLVKAVGETTVKAMETGFDIVKTLVTQGPAAAWQQILQGLTNLKDMVLEQIMSFVKDRIVTAAITKLLSMLSPAGAFIQAIIATYNTVMFFVERLRQIAQVAASFIDSIAAIAAGALGAAANRVETTLAGLLTLVISFLARIAGLGKVSDAVLGIVKRVRQPIDKALDRVVAWIVAQAKKLGKFLAGKIAGKDERSPAEKQRDLDRAVRELRPKIEPMLRKGSPSLVLKAKLFVWKQQYKLTELAVVGKSLRATINPTAEMFSVEEKQLGALLEPILQQAEKLYLLAVARHKDSKDRLDKADAAAKAGRKLPKHLTQEEAVILMRRQGLLVNERMLQRQGFDVRLRDRRRFVPDAGSYFAGHLPGMPATWTGKRWTDSVNATMAAGQNLDRNRGLRDEVEVARHQGNLPANRVAAGLVDVSDRQAAPLPLAVDRPGIASDGTGPSNTVTEEEMTYGRMAPMAARNAAAAGSTAEYRPENPSPSEQKSLDDATEVRHGSYAVIFNTLSAAAKQQGDPVLSLPGDRGNLLKAVAAAFDAWKAVAIVGGKVRYGQKVDAAADKLKKALIDFMAAK